MARKSVRWLPIPGYEGRYDVSDEGDVWSSARGGRYIKTPAGSCGYPQFMACIGGARRTMRVHVAVLLAFHGPRPEGMEARHINGVKADNRAENLLWGTRVENAADKVLHGVVARGEHHGISVLTQDVVHRIRSLSELGLSQRQIASRVGFSRSSVRDVVKGKTWGWLT